MFDFLKSGGTPGSGPPDNKEMSVETRLLLAFILMGAVLFTTPYFFKTPPPSPKKAETVTTAHAPAPAAEQPSSSAPASSPSSSSPSSPSSAPVQVGASRE